jgi:membrane-associated phospholipid phosphatase
MLKPQTAKKRLRTLPQARHKQGLPGIMHFPQPWKRFWKLDQLLLPASLIRFALFVPLAWWTRRHRQPLVDIVLTRTLQHKQPTLMRRIVIVVSTLLGSAVFLNVLAVPAAIIFWKKHLRLEALMTIGIAWTNALVRTLIKQVVHRPRPNPLLVRRTKLSQGKSFPSGHVASALTFWGWLVALGMLRLERKRSWQRGLLSLPVLFLMLVGPTRIYLGEHWTTDVLGGYLFGGGWLCLALRWYLTLRNKRIRATS